MEIPLATSRPNPRDKSSGPRFSGRANQESLRAKLTIARASDVTGVTERRDFAVWHAGAGTACPVALRAERGAKI